MFLNIFGGYLFILDNNMTYTTTKYFSPASWEYRVEHKEWDNPSFSQNELNKLGQEGWELIQIFSDQFISKVCWYFKRPLLVDNNEEDK